MSTTSHPPSLLQTALLSSKLHALDLSPGRRHARLASDEGVDSEDDEGSVVGVETPGRAQSPAFGQRSSSRKRLSGAPAEAQPKSTDPLRAFPNDIGIQIFARLDFKSLARCARVSKRWNQSQTINYIWYRHYKEHQFSHGEDAHEMLRRQQRSSGLEKIPPAGRWGRKESKDDWRRAYKILIHAPPTAGLVPYDPVESPYASGPPSPSATDLAPIKLGPLGAPVGSKNEAREQYRELKGRKSRLKRGMSGVNARDKTVTGFDGVQEDPYGDGRFDAPF